MEPVDKPNLFQNFINLFKPKESKITEIAVPNIKYVVVNKMGSIKPGRFKVLDRPQTPMSDIRDQIRKTPNRDLIKATTGNPVTSLDFFTEYEPDELFYQMKIDIARLHMSIKIDTTE